MHTSLYISWLKFYCDMSSVLIIEYNIEQVVEEVVDSDIGVNTLVVKMSTTAN